MKKNLPKEEKYKKYLSYIQLIDRETHELFSDKLNIICIELPRFGKKMNEEKTFLEQWIYLIKNMHKLKDMPEEMKAEIFETVFGIAKIAQMSKEEVNRYLKSLSDMNAVKNQFNRMSNTIVTVTAERDNAWVERDNAWVERDNAWVERDNAWVERDNAWVERNNALEELKKLKQQFGLD